MKFDFPQDTEEVKKRYLCLHIQDFHNHLSNRNAICCISTGSETSDKYGKNCRYGHTQQGVLHAALLKQVTYEEIFISQAYANYSHEKYSK